MKKLLPLSLPAILIGCNLLAPTTGAQARAAAATAGASGYHALVIGNNDYASLPKLKTAEADARQVAALLKESYGFETSLLLNATRAQIVSALAGYRRRLGPEARFLVYYAGHGYNDREQDKAYWLPVDATRDDPTNWIIADEITSAIRVIPARQILVVSDSCYSGTLTRGLGESLPPPNERERFIERMAVGRSRMLMASGGNEPVADGGGSGHSVFAAALLRGLREMGRDRFTAAELFRNYVLEPVAGRAQQTPEYNPIRNSGHEGGDFIFVNLKAGGVAPAAAANPPGISAAPDPAAVELSYWNSIKDSNDPELFESYLKRFPNGLFAEIAKSKVPNFNAQTFRGIIRIEQLTKQLAAQYGVKGIKEGLIVIEVNPSLAPGSGKSLKAGDVLERFILISDDDLRSLMNKPYEEKLKIIRGHPVPTPAGFLNAFDYVGGSVCLYTLWREHGAVEGSTNSIMYCNSRLRPRKAWPPVN